MPSFEELDFLEISGGFKVSFPLGEQGFVKRAFGQLDAGYQSFFVLFN